MCLAFFEVRDVKAFVTGLKVSLTVLGKLAPKKISPHYKTYMKNVALCKMYMEKSSNNETCMENSSENFLTEFYRKAMLCANISWP